MKKRILIQLIVFVAILATAACGSPLERALNDCREKYPIEGANSTWDWERCPQGRAEYDGCTDRDIMVACIRMVQAYCNPQQAACFASAR